MKIILFVCLVISLNAQSRQITFDNVKLSQNTVLGIIQDNTGFMWFGTWEGLNRYDGYDIKVFKNSKNDSTSISSSNINQLHKDNKGRIWCSSIRLGISLFIPELNAFKPGSKLANFIKKPQMTTSFFCF